MLRLMGSDETVRDETYESGTRRGSSNTRGNIRVGAGKPAGHTLSLNKGLFVHPPSRLMEEPSILVCT